MTSDPKLASDRPDPAPITPEDKDWTWTLTQTCEDCGLRVADLKPGEIGPVIRAVTGPWAQVLARPDASDRPGAAIWSPVEYAAHVRDVCTIMNTRLKLMLDEDSPEFENWDQDATAVQERYDLQDPARVAEELTAQANAFADAYDAVPADAWERTGTRSNGSPFTVLTLGQYALHDLSHHLWDVQLDPAALVADATKK